MCILCNELDNWQTVCYALSMLSGNFMTESISLLRILVKE